MNSITCEAYLCSGRFCRIKGSHGCHKDLAALGTSCGEGKVLAGMVLDERPSGGGMKLLTPMTYISLLWLLESLPLHLLGRPWFYASNLTRCKQHKLLGHVSKTDFTDLHSLRVPQDSYGFPHFIKAYKHRLKSSGVTQGVALIFTKPNWGVYNDHKNLKPT